jgi:hypothetical protein
MPSTPKTDPEATEDDVFDEPDQPADPGAFDLDLRAEAAPAATLRIVLPTGELVLPRSMDDWTGESINLMTEGKFRDALLEVCADSEDNLALIRPLTIGQINQIMDHVMKVTGITPGESSRSAKSSRSTATKRKRI